MIIDFKKGNAEEFGLKIRCSKDKTKKTVLKFISETGKFELNRDLSGDGYKGVRRCKLIYKDTLRVHIICENAFLKFHLSVLT